MSLMDDEIDTQSSGEFIDDLSDFDEPKKGERAKTPEMPQPGLHMLMEDEDELEFEHEMENDQQNDFKTITNTTNYSKPASNPSSTPSTKKLSTMDFIDVENELVKGLFHEDSSFDGSPVPKTQQKSKSPQKQLFDNQSHATTTTASQKKSPIIPSQVQEDLILEEINADVESNIEEYSETNSSKTPRFSKQVIENIGELNQSFDNLIQNYEKKMRQQDATISKIQQEVSQIRFTGQPNPQNPQKTTSPVENNTSAASKTTTTTTIKGSKSTTPNPQDSNQKKEESNLKDDDLNFDFESEEMEETQPGVSTFVPSHFVEINNALRKNGFMGINDCTSIEQVISAIRNSITDVLEKYSQRGRMLEEVSEHSKSVEEKTKKYKTKILKLSKHAEDQKKQLETTQKELNQVLEKQNSHVFQSERQIKKAEKQFEIYESRIREMEGISSSKDVELEKLKKQLEKQINDEENRKKNAKRIFEQYHQKKPNSKADEAEVNLVIMYEDLRKKLLKENASLRGRVQELSISNILTSPNAQKVEEKVEKAHNSMDKQLEIKEEIENLKQEMNQNENEAKKKIEELQTQNNEMKKQNLQIFQKLKQTLTEKQEIQSKLSEKQQKTTEKQQKDTEKQEDSKKTPQKQNKDNSKSKYILELSPLEMNDKKTSIPEDRKSSSKELILQKCCEILKINAVEELIPSISKMVTVLKSVPQLEGFISSICNILGDEIVKNQQNEEKSTKTEAQKKEENVSKVVKEILVKWKSKLELYDRFLKDFLNLMGKRKVANVFSVDKNFDLETSYYDILRSVQSLILTEQNYFNCSSIM